MPTVHQLLQNARDCYVEAKQAVAAETKNTLIRRGDRYWKQAEILQERQRVTRAVLAQGLALASFLPDDDPTEEVA